MEKTFGLLLMIILGVVLQQKITHSDQLKGIKIIILSLALPATIFVALLSVEVESELLLLPIIGLAINLLLLGLFAISLPLFPSLDDRKRRTLLMLMPSLAPGLSCFPFILEYLGDEPLAMAALLDVGNKLFVLIILYLIAMRWYLKINQVTNAKNDGRIKKMLIQMLGEPINIIMIVALVMLGLGWNLNTLPSTVSNLFIRLSAIMAPLVLLFIGLAVKIEKKQIAIIGQLLTWRAGLAFIFSALFIFFVPNLSTNMILVAIVFPQSSVSFWPYAHMIIVANQEKDKSKTFDLKFSVAVLAFSLPFSSILIMTILSFPQQSSDPSNIGILGALLFGFSILPQTVRKVKSLA